jgi:hypothetical protein
MLLSKRKLEANRANAQKSLGPVTPEGKARVSQNRTVHGLTGRFRVLESEDQSMFDDFVDQLILEEKPVGLLETELVKKMAECLWSSRRARNLQDGCFHFGERSPEDIASGQIEIRVRPDLERYTRYQAHHDRAFQRFFNDFLRLRKERQKAASGFESQQRAAQTHEWKMAVGQEHLQQEKIRTFTAHAVAAKRFGTFSPPETGQIAA